MVTIEIIPRIIIPTARQIHPQGHERELKIPRYHKTNSGRQMNENIITKRFNAGWPSFLKINVNNIKKSIINTIETIAFQPTLVKNLKMKIIKSSAMDVIRRK